LFVVVLPFLHGVIVWQHKWYVFTAGVQINLIFAVIWYFLCGIAINIVMINIDDCGFSELPKISDFKEG
jgi:hypothetical protein